MATLQIPLVPTNQKLSIQLNATVYNLETRWNEPAGCWVLDIYDVDFEPVLTGIGLVTGADLLEQFGYLEIGGELWVGPGSLVPTFDTLGVTTGLYFVPTS